MRAFTEKELRAFWKLLKAKWRKKHMMDFFQLTADEATEMYKQAEALHGGGLREPKEKPQETQVESMPTKKKYQDERPAAVYTNRTREQVIDELEKKEI